MPGEATETVPVTEQEMQQPQVETGSYVLTSRERACDVLRIKQRGPGTQQAICLLEEQYLLIDRRVIWLGGVDSAGWTLS